MSNRYPGSEAKPINIVLVGRAGNGKSATGNSLVKGERFPSGAQATGLTITCQTFRAVTKNGQIINVIDTPGLFDLMTSREFISNEIVRCLALAEEGLHAVVLVLSVSTRMTQEEEEALCTLQRLFGSTILDYLIVVFTGGDRLETDNQTLEEYLSPCPPFLTSIFTLSGNRKVVFDNKTKDQNKKEKQIQELLNHVDVIGRKNNGIPFTEEMHRQIKKENITLKEGQKAAEYKFFSETDIQREKERFKETYDRNMIQMATLLQGALEKALDANQKALAVIERNERRRGSCNIM